MGLSYMCTYSIPLTKHQWLAQTTVPLIPMSNIWVSNAQVWKGEMKHPHLYLPSHYVHPPNVNTAVTLCQSPHVLKIQFSPCSPFFLCNSCRWVGLHTHSNPKTLGPDVCSDVLSTGLKRGSWLSPFGCAMFCK